MDAFGIKHIVTWVLLVFNISLSGRFLYKIYNFMCAFGVKKLNDLQISLWY